jgi:para-nitrobenzyl esterase
MIVLTNENSDSRIMRRAVPYSLIIAGVLICLAVPAISQTPVAPVPGDPVNIDSGLISGKRVSANVKAYLGIPYAAPPVGDLRWREPQPVKAWTGIRAADQYGPSCPQRGPARGGAPAYNEDCLFLNVWAPISPPVKKLPVIVYIYGGGYNSGSGSAPVLSGEFLANRGVVYVNFNYRLSVLGSLGLPALTAESPHRASSHYVHMDEIAVLQWVHRNVVKFGGDPGNVTLMGQSSGAMDVCYLQGSPLTRGLIHRVVAMSGSTFPGGPWGARPLQDVEAAGLKFQEKLGVKSLAELRTVPWERLLESSWIDINEPTAADGYVLQEPTPAMFAARRQTDVPSIVEWCRDEIFSGFSDVKTLDEYKAAVRRVAGAKAEEMLRIFPASNDEEARQAALEAGRAGAVSKQMMGWAVAQSAGKSPTFVSVFSYGQTAGHGKDVAYWHGTVRQAAAAAGSRGGPVTAYDSELSDKMSDALIAFAKTGNPGTPAIKWPRFDPKNPYRLDFGDRVEAVPIHKGVFFYIANPEVKVGFREGGRGDPVGPSGPQGPGRQGP